MILASNPCSLVYSISFLKLESDEVTKISSPPGFILDLIELIIFIGTINPSFPPSVLTSDISLVLRYGRLQITRSN